jgi:ribose/xylose/arabinose/galactoside ABC-type transport system permease subunit
MTASFFNLGGGAIFGLPNPFIIFVVLSVIASLVLSRSVYGRQLYAVGGNERAARLTGLGSRSPQDQRLCDFGGARRASPASSR